MISRTAANGEDPIITRPEAIGVDPVINRTVATCMRGGACD